MHMSSAKSSLVELLARLTYRQTCSHVLTGLALIILVEIQPPRFCIEAKYLYSVARNNRLIPRTMLGRGFS